MLAGDNWIADQVNAVMNVTVGSTAIFLTYTTAAASTTRPAAPTSDPRPMIVISPFAKPPPRTRRRLLRLAPDLHRARLRPRAAVAERRERYDFSGASTSPSGPGTDHPDHHPIPSGSRTTRCHPPTRRPDVVPSRSGLVDRVTSGKATGSGRPVKPSFSCVLDRCRLAVLRRGRERHDVFLSGEVWSRRFAGIAHPGRERRDHDAAGRLCPPGPDGTASRVTLASPRGLQVAVGASLADAPLRRAGLRS